jgi:hypothetical protein
MIYYLTRRAHAYTIQAFLASFWGQSMRRSIQVLTYERLLQARRIPVGHYIFADIERLSPAESERAAVLWHHLHERLGPDALLNHPTQSLRRYPLLRTLYEDGVNHFNVYRLTEMRQPQRFPVFIRGENDHQGAGSALLHSPAELATTIAQLENAGKSLFDKIITEFCDTADPQGIRRKYSALVIGDQIIPRHIFFSQKDWMIKHPDLKAPHLTAEEIEFATTNPHADQLQHIFKLAKIRFGRIDYGCLEGKVQVWEINTNPMMLTPAENPNPQDPREPVHKAFGTGMVNALQQFEAKPAVTVSVNVPANIPATLFIPDGNGSKAQLRQWVLEGVIPAIPYPWYRALKRFYKKHLKPPAI